MARLKSELTVECPCCHATLVVDTNLKRVVSHVEPERGDKPNLDDAQGILRAETARREALFEDSVHNERTRGDALSKRFEEALRQAREEPITRPKRDFDWDSGRGVVGGGSPREPPREPRRGAVRRAAGRQRIFTAMMRGLLNTHPSMSSDTSLRFRKALQRPACGTGCARCPRDSWRSRRWSPSSQQDP